MANKYAATCYRCGLEIPPGEGVFEKTGKAQRKKWPGLPLPKWLAQHHSCAAEWKGTTRHYQWAQINSPK
jgi:hypothetical protein